MQAKIASTSFNESLDIAVSPCKANPQTGLQEIIVMAMLKEPISVSPPLRVQFGNSSGEQKQIEFRLPIFMNKLTEPVDMPIEAFAKTWDDITHNRPASF